MIRHLSDLHNATSC